MAIEHLVFGDADSKDYNIEVFFKDIDHTPKRVYERIEVPGRNGAILVDEKRYEDVSVAYDCVALNDADRSAFVNALAAQIGYHRLQDSFNSDEFYSAVFDGDVDPNMTAERDRSTFTIYFTRAAQRFLTSGEEPVTIGEWGETETASGSIASFEAKEGDAVKSLVVDIEPLQSSSGTPSPTSAKPISGYDSVAMSVTRKNLLNVDDAEIGTDWSGTSNSARARIIIPCKPNTAYTLSMNGTMSVDDVYYVSSKAIPPTMIAGPVTFPVRFTTGSTHKYITLGFSKTAITKADIEALKLQLEFGSTATAYEPYQGNTYTINLNGTRYGGTLDVASGVLTVTKAIVDLGDLTSWTSVSISGSGNRFFSNDLQSIIEKPTDASVKPDIMCSGFPIKLPSQFGQAVQGITIYTNGAVQVYDASLSSLDASAFTSAVSGITLVYPLATPTTVQLTAQEVELLVGLNQVWANSGDVSVEYGTAPNVVYNPTLFDSSPMLEVEGYGTIAFNGYEIELDDALIGEITLANGTTFKVKDKTINLDTSLLNNGDTITVSGIRLSLYAKMSSYTIGNNTSVSDSNSSFTSSWSGAIRANPGQWKSINVHTVLPSFSFTKGNTATHTDIVTINLKDQNGTFTATCGITVTASANAVSITRTVSTSPQYRCGFSTSGDASYIDEIKGDSTQTYLGNPTIIDCDLGAAYRVDDGVVTSLNQYIDLGSDLPKLASRANTITADNTVTDLKVIPRWWKI